MKLSVGLDNSTFEPVEISEDELDTFILKGDWSPAVYKNNHRKNENFISADCLALDFDEGLLLERAKHEFRDYKHIIGTTRNHQKEKNGVVSDRFRVVLFPEERITDARVYTSTIIDLLKKYPQADKACKDAARMFYACSTSEGTLSGKRIKPVFPKLESVERSVTVPVSGMGQISKATSNFLLFGTDINWNLALFKAAKDLHEQGYSIEQATELLVLATRSYVGKLDAVDKKTIKSAFKEKPRHDARNNNAFDFKNIKQLFTEQPKIEWFVDRLLTKGGISVIAGPPKSGKSTIIRQLTAAASVGGEFLGRKIEQGNIVYLALEEQPAIVYDQFKALGVREDDPIVFHAGPPNKHDAFEDFKEYIEGNQPALVVIDTLVMFANIMDQNNYKEVYSAINKYRSVARNSGTHIVCIHHTNKGGGYGTQSIMGSSAFTGAVDAIMYFENIGGKRFLTTEGRGTLNFSKQPLVYSTETQSYELGGDNEF